MLMFEVYIYGALALAHMRLRLCKIKIGATADVTIWIFSIDLQVRTEIMDVPIEGVPADAFMDDTIEDLVAIRTAALAEVAKQEQQAQERERSRWEKSIFLLQYKGNRQARALHCLHVHALAITYMYWHGNAHVCA